MGKSGSLLIQRQCQTWFLAVSVRAQTTTMIKACVIRLWAPAILLGGMVLATSVGRAEAQAAQSASPTVQSATRSLLDKAHALELRGRMDLAVQTWQEVLLADPRNTEALGGLARAAQTWRRHSTLKQIFEPDTGDRSE